MLRLLSLATLILGMGCLLAAPKKPAQPAVPLTAEGTKLKADFAATLKTLQTDIQNAVPRVAEQKKSAIEKAREVIASATQTANASAQSVGKINEAKALVAHAQGKWIGGAEKGIAQAQAALKKATTDGEREKAKKELVKWQENKEAGLKALKERQEMYEKAKANEAKLTQANQAAQKALTQARADEMNAAKSILSDVQTFLASDKLDAKLVKCVILTEATPHGLAVFAQQGKEQATLVQKLLADDQLMKEMLIAGGARGGNYGRAMEIYSAIQRASSKANGGTLQRLALATSLEHALPIKQGNSEEEVGNGENVDPVQRYLHYEKAFLDGELDPAFKNFTVWEYRMVVNCDAPDTMLAWGREMLRTYRPDHIQTANYGWRYVAAVKTDVSYGSQNVKDDLPSLNKYQNIMKNGGVCGRRAFFGRFILRSFGIPTWGVTQFKHAAVSHWTPNGWVVNLGAGFQASWWDHEAVPVSGLEFLLETQAREHKQDYLKVLRAKWASLVLGEPAHNERRKVAGGFWSNLARYQSMILASTAVPLGPLGQDLAEANESKVKEKVQQATATKEDQKVVVSRDGTITIPSVGFEKAAKGGLVMKSFKSGMQLHSSGGFKTQYAFEAPAAGKYRLSAKVATVQEGQKFQFAANEEKKPIETKVPYTIGMWKQTEPVEITLVKGRNVLHFALAEGSRGVTIKEFALAPVK
jgi:hypothetical protein